jgi:hypothetical protein
MSCIGDHAGRRQLDKHPAERVPARLVVGGEHRAADEFADQWGRELEARLRRKRGDRGELERVLGRQAELASRRLDDRGGAVGVDLEHRAGGALADDRGQPAARQEHGPRREHLDGVDLDADADLQVGRRQHRALAASLEFHVREYGLGRSRGNDGGGALQGRQQRFPRATDFHERRVPGMGEAGREDTRPGRKSIRREPLLYPMNRSRKCPRNPSKTVSFHRFRAPARPRFSTAVPRCFFKTGIRGE